MANFPDQVQLERIKTLVAPEIDQRIENELEDYDTKVNKKMTAFFNDKIKAINAKLESQDAAIQEHGDHIKTIEGNIN